MNLYRLFILSFIMTLLALGAFIVSYFHALAGIIELAGREEASVLPVEVFRRIFSPALIISGLVLTVAGILYKVLGIVFIARNPNLESGEKAMWIIGFVMLGFITAIVFMAMASSRNLTVKERVAPVKY